MEQASNMPQDWNVTRLTVITQETAFPKVLKRNWPVPYSVIQTNINNVNGELEGEKRLNWILLLFPRA